MVQEGQAGIVGGNLHLVIFPAAAIALLTLAFTFLGDGLRDALDPNVDGRARPSQDAETRRGRDAEAPQELPKAA
jgi:hypothetical protein